MDPYVLICYLFLITLSSQSFAVTVGKHFKIHTFLFFFQFLKSILNNDQDYCLLFVISQLTCTSGQLMFQYSLEAWKLT